MTHPSVQFVARANFAGSSFITFANHVHSSSSTQLLKEPRKGFLQLMYMSGQLNRKISCFWLLKQIMDWLMTGMLKCP